MPEQEASLARLFRFVHRHYSCRINFRENWKGHLWQERLDSFVMDERHLMGTVRCAELNPVRARLCREAEDWPWSSARAHLVGWDDAAVSVQPLLERVADWRRYLSEAVGNEDLQRIRRCSGIWNGRLAFDTRLIEQLEALTGRELKTRKPGRKPAIK